MLNAWSAVGQVYAPAVGVGDAQQLVHTRELRLHSRQLLLQRAQLQKKEGQGMRLSVYACTHEVV